MVQHSLTQPKTLRFGVVCSGTQIAAWQADCLSRLVATPGVEFGLLISSTPTIAKASQQERRGRLKQLPWRLFYSRRVLPLARSAQPADLSAVLTPAPQIRANLDTENGFATLPPQIVSQIAEHDLDMLLWLAPGTPHGGILETTRFGVWGYRYGQEAQYAGFPPGLLEILRGDPITTASLCRFGPPGRGAVLRQGAIGTLGSSYHANLDAVRSMSAAWPAQVCIDILHDQAIGEQDLAVDLPLPPNRAPGWLVLVRLALRVAGNRLGDLYQAYGTFWEWTIGVVDQPIAAFLDPDARPPARWLSLPGERTFWADPFALVRDEGLQLFFEDYDYASRRGRISTVHWNRSSTEPPQVVIDEDWHLSYPYLIEDRGRVYCIPESCEIGEIALYRADQFPHSWTKVATLVEGFAGSDATVFWHLDRWWLLACDSSKDMDHALYAWHAESLLGPWTAHCNNPIKVDVRSSRPAGTPFIHDGHLYRPAQDCSGSYGSQVVLNRVDRLTEIAFAEKTVASIQPDRDGPYPDGLHTLSAVGTMSLVDGLRNVPILTRPTMIAHGLRIRLERLLARHFRRGTQ